MPREGRLGELGGRQGQAQETHFFTGIFPSGLSCILSFTRLEGWTVAHQSGGWEANPLSSGVEVGRRLGEVGNRHLHLVQECASGSIGCHRVFGESQHVLSPVLQNTEPPSQAPGHTCI